MFNAFAKFIAVPTALLLILCSHSSAQDTLKKPASLAFDINGQAILKSKFMTMLPPPEATGGRLNILNSKRFFGAVSLPESIEQVGQFQPGGEFPVEFIAVAEFDTKEARESVINSEKLAGSETTTINGKTYFIEPSVENIHLLLEEKRFEVGTKPFLAIPKSALLSNNLKTAMGDLGKAPVKIVLDLTADPEFFVNTVDMLKQQGMPPTVTPFLELAKRIDELLLAIDPDGAEMIKLVARSSKPEDAAFVAKSLNMLVGFAKLGIQSGPAGSPEVELGQAILSAASVETKGNQAVLLVKRPSNFDAIMERAVAAAKEAGVRANRMNDFKQIMLAVHNYESTYRKTPFIAHNRFSEDLSWRVRILPFVEEVGLFNQFDQTQAWDSEKNKSHADNCPRIFGKDGKTNKCWIVSEVTGFQDVTDGLSNTICIIENPKLVPWTQASDISIEEVEKLVLGLADGETLIAGMYDGSVRQLDNKIPAEKLHALLTPNGGERITDF